MGESISAKPLTLFQHLEGLTSKKTPWEELTDSDRKSFSPYMVARFLSMQIELTEFVNDIQKYTTSLLKPRDVYKLYLDLLPKKKIFFKYIKGKSEDKFDSKLVNYISKYFECSNENAIDYLGIYFSKDEYKLDLIKILRAYGLQDKEIKKLVK